MTRGKVQSIKATDDDEYAYADPLDPFNGWGPR